MLEVLKHLLGFCGEHWHPSILNISVIIAAVTPFFYQVRNLVKHIWKSLNFFNIYNKI